MAEQKTCTYVVDYSNENECEVTCGSPAEFQCDDEFLCPQHAHDWLDELEPKHWSDVIALGEDEPDNG